MAQSNVTAGLLTLGQGLGQLGAVPEYQRRLRQMELEQATKEQQLELNQMALKSASEQAANARLTNLGQEYIELDKGVTPDWFATKDEEINKLATNLGTKPENIRLRIKSQKQQFQESKNLSIGHLNLFDSAIGKLSPEFGGDLASQIGSFKTAIGNAKTPEELKAVVSGNEKLIEQVAGLAIRLQDKDQTVRAKTGAQEAKVVETIRGEIDNFNNHYAKEELKALSGTNQLNRVLQDGDTNKAAEGLAKMFIAKKGGNTNPSNKDLEEIDPNPGFVEAAQRWYDWRFRNKPLKLDVDQLKSLANTLKGSIETDIKDKAASYAAGRKGLIPGIDQPELEQRLLSTYGLQSDKNKREMEGTKPPPGSSSDAAAPQLDAQKTQAIYSQAQAILASPQSPPEVKAKAQAALDKLKKMGFKVSPAK